MKLLSKPVMLFLMLATGIAAATESPHSAPSSQDRVEDVARRGALVMPFDLDRTRHVFTRNASGGVQRVVVQDAKDAPQIMLIRKHLAKVSAEFRQGRFTDPEQIHGEEMPGLRELRAARPGQLHIDVREHPLGGEIIYRSDDTKLVAALHRWFDGQLADHGKHAMPGHHGH